MSAFCRGCLIKYDEFIELLQFTEKNRRLYVYATSIQVKQNDMEFQLCKGCYVSMKLACKFKKQCRNSDKLLKNYFAIKETGDNLDLSTYLKHKDVSLTFRLPMLVGNNTPAHHKAKEDDNESTCTSIRNFMTDIMHHEEILDTEARIIQEVMQEEPEVLEDSLDSHWLEDDAFIDTDFRLDFGISPFSTPRPVSNYQNYLETKVTAENQENYISTISKSNDNNYDKETGAAPSLTEVNSSKEEILAQNFEFKIFDTGRSIEKEKIKIEGVSKSLTTAMTTKDGTLNELQSETRYKDFKNAESQNMNKSQNSEKTDSTIFQMNYQKCSIDRNLENALRDPNSHLFSLSDVLASSPDFVGITPASTPRIRDVIYGDDPNLQDEFIASDEINQVTENDKNNDILEDFFKENADLNEENGVIEAYSQNCGLQKLGKGQINMETFDCVMCQRRMKSLKGLKTHFAKHHKLKIIENVEERNNRIFKKHRICDYCSKEYNSIKAFSKHIKMHMRPDKEKCICEYCHLEFTTQSKLRTHQRTHGNVENGLEPENQSEPTVKKPKKIFVCPHCAAQFTYQGNLNVHVRRHNKDYTTRCSYCSKGFFRKYDLEEHMRKHTGERPHKCTQCEAAFARRDALLLHIKGHFKEKNFICQECGAKFATNFRLNEHNKSHRRCKKAKPLEIVSQENEIEMPKESSDLTSENDIDKLLAEGVIETNTTNVSESLKSNAPRRRVVVIDPEWESLILGCQKRKYIKSIPPKKCKRTKKGSKATKALALED